MDNDKSLMAEKKDRTLIDGLLDIIRGIKNNLKIRLAKSEKAMLDEAERNLVNLLRSESREQIQARYAVKLNETDIKRKQLEAIKENNPADDDIQKEFIKIGDKLNIFENYSTDDVDFEFKMSHGTINESVEKQEYSYADLTKAINFVRNVVENAVVIDIHRDKYIGTEREDKDLLCVYELVSAYKYGNKIIPIKMTVKNFKTKEDTLYCVTTFEKIKEADIITATAAVNDSLYTVQSTSNIKLADLLKNVNKNSDLGKYIPSQFYNDYNNTKYSVSGTE